MKPLIFMLLATVVSALSLIGVAGCANNAHTPPSLANFRSDKYYLSAAVPEGWGSSEGPAAITSLGRVVGQVAFNSWGENGFWAREEHKGNSYTYSPEVVLSQIPTGGAYLVLVEVHGPPSLPGDSPPEYTSNDLGDLLKDKGWRFDKRNELTFIPFNKWEIGRGVDLGYKADASDSTVDQLDSLLLSIRFDAAPAGNTGWAVTVARKLLPEKARPAKFSYRAGTQGDQNVARKTEVDVGEDNTVHFRFTYFWNLTPDWNAWPSQSPSNTFHWWEIDVYPDGKSELIDQGGAPL